MGQKLVKFSDLSGELITEEEAVARIVIHEHPELGGSPVEIEVQADEARAVEKAAVAVALVEIYLPGDDEPRRVAMDLAAFDKLATEKPMSELLLSGRPAKRAVKTREKRSTSRDERPAGSAEAASPDRAAPDKAAPDKAAPDKAAAVKAAPAKAAAALGVAGPAKLPAPSAASPKLPAPSAASLAAAGLSEASANVA
jgi:hypothetical protein